MAIFSSFGSGSAAIVAPGALAVGPEPEHDVRRADGSGQAPNASRSRAELDDARAPAVARDGHGDLARLALGFDLLVPVDYRACHHFDA